MALVGPAAAVALCMAAALLAVRAGLDYGAVNAFGLATGAVSIIAMSQCLALAARPRFLEPLFGGLDRMYRVHKWLGIAALAAFLLHDMAEPEFERWVREGSVGEFGAWLGEVAYYGLAVLILLSWLKRVPLTGWEIPWRLWWFTHRLTGAFFALAVLHQLLVPLPISRSDPLMLLLNAAGIVGIFSYLFVELVARRWRRRAHEVRAVETRRGATILTLAPRGRPMRWRPGQFAFLSLPERGPGEAHPFTISGPGGAGGEIRFTIKPLGDWTRALPDRVRPGMTVEVEGPYGRFDFRKGRRRQVWIAGGVGITPFLAWVHDLSEREDRQIRLFYSVRNAEEAVGLDDLREAEARLPGFSFDLVVTGRDGRLDAGRIAAGCGFDVNGADVFFCGPLGLRDAVLKDLAAAGLEPAHVRFELFEFR